MTKAELENGLRNDVLSTITAALGPKYETDILGVGVGEIALPLVDAEGNEKFVLVKVSVPRGTRKAGGYEPYDGYQAKEDFEAENDRKAKEKEARRIKKEDEEKERERKRAIRRKVEK